MGVVGRGVGLVIINRVGRSGVPEKLTFEETPEGGEGVNLAELLEQDGPRQRELQVQRP